MSKRYDTPKKFKAAVNRYFDRITVKTPLKDEKGNPILNVKGKPVTSERFVIPPDLTALALSMGLTGRAWRNYAYGEGYEDYHEICARAKQRIEAWLMEQLNTRDRPQGIIFNLQNNFGMTGKLEVETGPKTQSYEAMSLSEKRALLARTLKDMEEDLDGTAEDPG